MLTPNINKKYKNYYEKVRNKKHQKNNKRRRHQKNNNKTTSIPPQTNINTHQNSSNTYQKIPKKNITLYQKRYKPPTKPITSKNLCKKKPKSRIQTQNQNRTTQTPKPCNTNYNIDPKNTHKKTSYRHNKPNTKNNNGLGLLAKFKNNNKILKIVKIKIEKKVQKYQKNTLTTNQYHN